MVNLMDAQNLRHNIRQQLGNRKALSDHKPY